MNNGSKHHWGHVYKKARIAPIRTDRQLAGADPPSRLQWELY